MAMLLAWIAVTLPDPPKKQGNPDKHQEEQRNDRKCQTFIRAATEKHPHRQDEPDRQPNDRAINEWMEFIVGRAIVPNWNQVRGHGVLLNAVTSPRRFLLMSTHG